MDFKIFYYTLSCILSRTYTWVVYVCAHNDLDCKDTKNF